MQVDAYVATLGFEHHTFISPAGFFRYELGSIFTVFPAAVLGNQFDTVLVALCLTLCSALHFAEHSISPCSNFQAPLNYAAKGKDGVYTFTLPLSATDYYTGFDEAEDYGESLPKAHIVWQWII